MVSIAVTYSHIESIILITGNREIIPCNMDGTYVNNAIVINV